MDNKRWSDKKCNDNALMFNVSYKKDLVVQVHHIIIPTPVSIIIKCYTLYIDELNKHPILIRMRHR